jgi:hypothetical protein
MPIEPGRFPGIIGDPVDPFTASQGNRGGMGIGSGGLGGMHVGPNSGIF